MRACMQANPACTDKHGDTALHIAVNGALEKFVDKLLEVFSLAGNCSGLVSLTLPREVNACCFFYVFFLGP